MLSYKDIQNDGYTLYRLTVRGIKIFLKDKATVFFSLLAPLIILVLYVLFLGDVQVSSVKGFFPEGMPVDEKAVKAYVDCWMLAGVLGVACITVSLSVNNVMVLDKSHGILNDLLSSPVKKGVVRFSYFAINYVATVAIVMVVFVICLIYLAASSAWFLTVGDVFALIGTILYSTLSSTLITVFLCSFLKTESQLGGMIGILSAGLGFLIGAYMPMSIMPKAAQYISALLPGSHSAAIFRQLLMSGALENLGTGLPAELTQGLSEAFVMEVNFFGKNLNIGLMCAYLAVTSVIFLVLNVVFIAKKRKK